MIREYTCIVCPNSCSIQAEAGNDGSFKISGASCLRGEAYVRQELTDPRRTIATTVAVRGGDRPLASVRLTAPVPLGQVREAADRIHEVVLDAPVKAGQIVIHGLLGLDCDVIATVSVNAV